MQQWEIIHIHGVYYRAPSTGGAQNPDFLKHRAKKKVGHHDIEKGGGEII